MPAIETSPEVESFLLWLTVERGRASNTVTSYRRDLVRYEEFLSTKKATVLTASEDD
ncbi:MAG: site-specific integrase, partial [Acidimicrobiaceae bacterium]